MKLTKKEKYPKLFLGSFNNFEKLNYYFREKVIQIRSDILKCVTMVVKINCLTF